jgi:hypothetical protein
MPKKQSKGKRTKVKDLPKKDKKLSGSELKKVKGGSSNVQFNPKEFKIDDKPTFKS